MKTVITSNPLYLQFMCQRLDYCPTANVQCIVCAEAESGMPLAGVIYDAYNGASIMAHIWVAPHARPSKDWFAAIFDYPFNRLNVHKIIGQVRSTNKRAIELDQHFGFELECTVKGFYPEADLLVFTMTRDQCRVLNSPIWASARDRVARV